MNGVLAGLSMIAARLMSSDYSDTPVLQWWVNQLTGNHWATIEAKRPDRNHWIDQQGRIVELVSANLRRRRDDYSKVDLIDIRWDVQSTMLRHYGSDPTSQNSEAGEVVKRFGLHPAYDPGGSPVAPVLRR
jgi:hypothetical protein